jgi:hypothetical protein
LIREKAVHQFWLNRFDGDTVEAQFAQIGKVLDEEIIGAGISKK